MGTSAPPAPSHPAGSGTAITVGWDGLMTPLEHSCPRCRMTQPGTEPAELLGPRIPFACLARGPSPCPAPTLTFPLGPSGSRQVAKMCWGGWGLAASCLTSSSPMPRLDPVTRTLRASAAISAASAPGGDTRQDCRLLGVKRSWAQPRVWLWAPMGTGTVPAPALAPRLPWAELGSQGGPRAPPAYGTTCLLQYPVPHHSVPLKSLLPGSL